MVTLESLEGNAWTGMRAYLIHNPAAGPNSSDSDLSETLKFLRGEGIEILATKATYGEGDATTYAREAVAAGCDAVFLSGGDGTISQAAAGLIGSDTCLGILPGGTGNVLARQLNLPVAGPLHPKPQLESARALLAGTVRPVDLGRITLRGGMRRHFISWAGIGFDAMLNRTVNADPVRKKQLGIGAFVLAGFLTLRDVAGTSVRLRIDSVRVNRRIVMLVANNIQLYGVVFHLASRAVMDDGLLDIYAFQGTGPGRTLLHAIKLAANKHIGDPEVDIYRATRVEITTTRSMPVHVDGDYIGDTPIVIDVVPRSLKLLVPATAPASLFSDPSGFQASKETAVEWMQRFARDVGNAIRDKSSPQ